MKILHVITSVNRGGAPNFLMALVERQLGAGHQVRVAYLKGDGYWSAVLNGMGAPASDLALKFYGDPLAAWRLSRVIGDFNPDLINAHQAPAELHTRLALLIAPKSKAALVITKHNMARFCRLPGDAALARWVARRACGIIAVSDAVKGQCLSNGCAAAAEGRTVTIYNAIDLAPYDNVDPALPRRLRAQWGVGPAEFLIGTAARLVPVKALHVLIEGFALYLKNARRPAKLAISGVGPLGGDLRTLASRLGVSDRVIWAGFREDMGVIMSALDVFALTSDSEALGLALVEAMAAGKPVAATRVGGVPEVIEDGVTGLLVPPRRPEALAQALATLEDAGLRSRMGEAGRLKARRDFSEEKMFRDTMLFYEKCLEGNSTRVPIGWGERSS